MKEKKDCKIVQDLLPNYIEKLTNEETNGYIEEHLKECEDCKKTFENMGKDLNENTTNKDKKAVKYFKKYKSKLRVLRIILLLILIIFVGNTVRKMIIISDLSNKAEESISLGNYHREISSYEQGNFTKTEIFNMEDKKKIIITKMTDEGITITKTFATKISEEEVFDQYLVNIYTEKENSKIARLNQKMGISVDPQNTLKTDNLLHLLMLSTFASIEKTTYNGEECYYISNLENFAYGSIGMYINKETGLTVSTIGYEIEYSDGSLGRWPAGEYVYEFGTVTEADFVEPNVSEYEIR